MLWLWLDRFTEFTRGQRAVAIKNVSLTDDALSDYLPGFPVLPCSMIVEGLAWTGGILANDFRGFRERTVLAKVNKAVFHRPALPGHQLRYTAVLGRDRSRGRVHPRHEPRRRRVAGRSGPFLAHLTEGYEGIEGDLVDPAETLALMRSFGMYDVGRTPTGEPLDVAEKLLEGERAAEEAAAMYDRPKPKRCALQRTRRALRKTEPLQPNCQQGRSRRDDSLRGRFIALDDGRADGLYRQKNRASGIDLENWDGGQFRVCDLLFRRGPDFPSQAEKPEGSNANVPYVQLPPAVPETRRLGEGMMIVVPSLAARRQCQQGVVRAVLARSKRPGTDRMT